MHETAVMVKVKFSKDKGISNVIREQEGTLPLTDETISKTVYRDVDNK